MDVRAGEWEAMKARVLLRWPALTDDDIEATHGEREALVLLLERRLGYAHENAVADIDQVLSGKVFVPEVADATQHTGTSGPVDEDGRQVT